MRKILMIAAALALVASAPSFAQTVDKNGRCHDASGKFAKDEVCKGGAAKSAASKTTGAVTGAATSVERGANKAAKGAEAAVDPNGPYKLDAKGKCHDAKGKMAAKAKCA
jgi:hypothetical protein